MELPKLSPSTPASRDPFKSPRVPGCKESILGHLRQGMGNGSPPGLLTSNIILCRWGALNAGHPRGRNRLPRGPKQSNHALYSGSSATSRRGQG